MSEKVKYNLEFVAKSSTQVLYNCIGTASGLSEWFADNVTIDKDGIFTFNWDGSEERAKLLNRKTGESIRFQWEDDEEDNYYFEMKITVDALTNDVGLVITDFAEEDEIEENKQLWESQVHELLHHIGA